MIPLKMNWRLLCAEIHQENKNLPCGRNGIPPRSKSSRICYLSARIDDAVAEKARAIALHVSENSIM
jgi:hypothetical protein